MELFLQIISYVLFGFLVISFVLLVLGLIKPTIIQKILKLKNRMGRGKIVLVFGLICLAAPYLGVKAINFKDKLVISKSSDQLWKQVDEGFEKSKKENSYLPNDKLLSKVISGGIGTEDGSLYVDKSTVYDDGIFLSLIAKHGGTGGDQLTYLLKRVNSSYSILLKNTGAEEKIDCSNLLKEKVSRVALDKYIELIRSGYPENYMSKVCPEL